MSLLDRAAASDEVLVALWAVAFMLVAAALRSLGWL